MNFGSQYIMRWFLMNGKMRGQAAMEYLMTYGWALLVIVIVIGILLVLNPFQPPQGCRFDQLSFTCTDAIVKANGLIYLTITNGNNNAINVTNVTCVVGNTPTVPNMASPAYWGNNKWIQSQTTFQLTNSTTQTVNCSNNDATLSAWTGTAGNSFSGKVYIYYKNQEDPLNYPSRVAVASVSEKVS